MPDIMISLEWDSHRGILAKPGGGSSVWGVYGERFAPAYNGDLEAEPPAGSRDRAPDQEVLKVKYTFSFSVSCRERNLAYCQGFLGSFEISPTEQVLKRNLSIGTLT